MAIKFLRGIYGRDQVKTTRPVGFKFPIGLVASSALNTANSSTTATLGTVDLFMVAGGGVGGCSSSIPIGFGGGGGAGGVRLLTANSLSDITESGNPAFTTGITNFIPVVVGGSAGNSCFGSNFIACRGGNGGCGIGGSPGANKAGQLGGSGGGGARYNNPNPVNSYCGAGGPGVVGQGCNGGNTAAPNNGAAGGAALQSACNVPCLCNLNGLTTSFTGTPIRFGDGGNGTPTPTNSAAGTANRGNGGNGGNSPSPGGAGGSGIVAIRYCNPTAPTTPLATGGSCVCCTGGCIIHIFNSSGFLNVNTSFSIN